MPTLIVTDRAGTTRTVEGQSGLSIMEVIRAADFDELLALCGGCLSCATCHVHVDPDHLQRLPPIGEDESDLLDGSSHRTATSRLSCQLVFGEALDGLAVTIAPED